MPSDARTSRALDALAESRDRYRSAASAAHDQMAAYLAAHRARTFGHAQAAARDLGRFAAGRIDAERFGALFSKVRSLPVDVVERVERLVGVLAELLAERDDLFIADVAPGGDLRDTVERSLAHMGRVFGAVSAFQALKSGEYRPERHEPDIAHLPFARWNRRERILAPPLVVEVDGADVRAEALTEYLDGRLTIALVIRGVASPAPLARLIAPATFVMQATEPADLRAVADYDGPAILALVPNDAARFTNDPRASRSVPGRVRVSFLPSEPPKHALGWRSIWQQHEELAHLEWLSGMADVSQPSPNALVAEPGRPTAAVPGRPAAEVQAAEVERLTNWLLTESGLATGEPVGAGGAR